MLVKEDKYYVPISFSFIDSGYYEEIGVPNREVYMLLRRYTWRSINKGDEKVQDYVKNGYLVAKVSRRTLSKKTGYSTRYITKILAKLKEIGWIRIERKYQGANYYVLGTYTGKLNKSKGKNARKESFYADDKISKYVNEEIERIKEEEKANEIGEIHVCFSLKEGKKIDPEFSRSFYNELILAKLDPTEYGLDWDEYEFDPTYMCPAEIKRFQKNFATEEERTNRINECRMFRRIKIQEVRIKELKKQKKQDKQNKQNEQDKRNKQDKQNEQNKQDEQTVKNEEVGKIKEITSKTSMHKIEGSNSVSDCKHCNKSNSNDNLSSSVARVEVTSNNVSKLPSRSNPYDSRSNIGIKEESIKKSNDIEENNNKDRERENGILSISKTQARQKRRDIRYNREGFEENSAFSRQNGTMCQENITMVTKKDTQSSSNQDVSNQIEKTRHMESSIGMAKELNKKALENRMRRKVENKNNGKTKGNKNKTDKPNKTNREIGKLQALFFSEMKKKFGNGFVISYWGKKEYGQMRRLIDNYGLDLVQKGLVYLIKEWTEIRERMNIESVVPSVGILVGFNSSIFSELQLGYKSYNKVDRIGEYDSESAKRSPRYGWGDLLEKKKQRERGTILNNG